MALHQLTGSLSSSACSFNTCRLLPPHRNQISVESTRRRNCFRVQQCLTVSDQSCVITRRSANFHPPIWSYDFVQSFTSEYVGESYTKRLEELKADVKVMVEKAVDLDTLHQLELVDTLQRLGVSYHFDEEIDKILKTIYSNAKRSYHDRDTQKQQPSLSCVALEFRLLRQHGYYDIPAEVFCSFMDDNGKLKQSLSEDWKGMLCLYEAAYIMGEEESCLFHEIRAFTTTHLQEYVKLHNNDVQDPYIASVVSHALQLPLHWRVLRMEIRWFIDVCERKPGGNIIQGRDDDVLLELAKLDFNMVQAKHQEELKSMYKWWSHTGLSKKLSFGRNVLIESFLWTVGVQWKPQFGDTRRIGTIVGVFVSLIDDIYDVYGTLDELELFAAAIERWDVDDDMDQLPYYMKLCSLALHNAMHEISYDVLKEQEVQIIPYLKKVWTLLCKYYLVEARWYHQGYTPTFQEYMDNAQMSVAMPATLLCCYVGFEDPISKEAIEYLLDYPNLFYWTAIIIRLIDDLGTSSDELKRGDVPKSIQCYMHETGASEEEARQHMKDLIAATWMKVNGDGFGSPLLSNAFTDMVKDLIRMTQCIYEYGDGYAGQGPEIRQRLMGMLIQPIPMKIRE